MRSLLLLALSVGSIYHFNCSLVLFLSLFHQSSLLRLLERCKDTTLTLGMTTITDELMSDFINAGIDETLVICRLPVPKNSRLYKNINWYQAHKSNILLLIFYFN